MADPDYLLSEHEAAELLGLKAQTLRNCRCTGVGAAAGLPYVKFGKVVRYRRASLLAFIDSREVAA